MIFIDKSTNKLLGDQVTKDYLDNCCLDTATGRYSNVCYDKRDGYGNRFSSTNMGIYKKRMIDAIYRNQHGYCCYCLRKLNKKVSNWNFEGYLKNINKENKEEARKYWNERIETLPLGP